MATSSKVKGFISDADMEKASSTDLSSKKSGGFISDSDMIKMESSSSPTKKQTKFAEAGLEGFGEGATLGYLNNIQAVTEPLTFKALNFLTGKDVQADDYTTARDGYNKRQEILKKENPKSFGVGQIAGAAVSSIPVARAAQGATVLARAGQAAKAGAAYGALQNTSETEGEVGGLDLSERLINAGVGAATGAAASVGADGITKVGSKVIDGAYKLKNNIGNSLKKTANQLSENSTGATRVQAQKFSDDAGEFLLKEKVVGFGDNAENIAEKANKLIRESENTIDKSLKELDKKGVTVSADKIVDSLQNKIKELGSDSSQADVVRKLKTIVDDIISTGESNISVSAAEQTKRGFNKMAKNWQDPEKGQAGKVAYRAYRDAVEESAQAADPAIAAQFKNAKQVYGKLNPIADAAEKRAAQQNQSPIGGLLDTAAVIGGAAGSDDPWTGGALGIATALGRRKLVPRAGSSLAVTFDKIAKKLISDPKVVEVAKKSPEAFTNLVYSYMKPKEQELSSGIMNMAEDQSQKKGYEKWAADGADKVIEHDTSLSADEIDQVKNTKEGRALLIKASDLKPKSKAMEKIVDQIRSGYLKGDE